MEPAGVIDRLRGMLPPRSATSDARVCDAFYRLEHDRATPAGGAFRVVRDGDTIVRGVGLEPALQALAHSLHYGVAANAPSLVFVHAGVVTWRGAAILLPGPSGAGKSSLVEALVRHGATYFSDDAAPLDEAGLVHPYRKALTVKGGRTWRFATDDGEDCAAAPVGLILVLQHAPQAIWSPRRLSPGNLLMRLIENSVPAATSPDRTLRVLARLAATTPAFVGDRPDAEFAATAILEMFDRHHIVPAPGLGSAPGSST